MGEELRMISSVLSRMRSGKGCRLKIHTRDILQEKDQRQESGGRDQNPGRETEDHEPAKKVVLLIK